MTDQTAVYVFKLRSNVALDGDVTLAQMELRAFMPHDLEEVAVLGDLIFRYPQLATIQGPGSLVSHTRKRGTQGYISEAPLELLPDLVKRLSFIQHIYCMAENTDFVNRTLQRLWYRTGSTSSSLTHPNGVIIQAIPHCAILELSDEAVKQSSNPLETKNKVGGLLNAVMGRSERATDVRLAEKALTLKSTTSHIGHDVHYYKAKFFPRLARTLINICERRAPERTHRVMDNFVGSGTTLLEASTLGIPSIGIDIDPLSVMICEAKLKITRLDSTAVHHEATRVKESLIKPLRLSYPTQRPISFPEWLLKNRKMQDTSAVEISQEIANVRDVVESCNNPDMTAILRVAMSDAISRKIRMRFMGTGVGRFALSFAKASITDMFSKSMDRYAKITAVSEWMREELNAEPAEARVLSGDARFMPEEIGTFDILVTSPPYVPASSGRESYAKARAPSLIALGLEDAETVNSLVDNSVGSMRDNNPDLSELTAEERGIVDWLQANELRSIKAAPTAQYFLDMRQAFVEMRRSMTPGGMAIVVSGKQSTFYEFSTRRTLLVVDSAELLADEALRAGFEVEALHDVKLEKSNRNARPRSLDDYYETLVMLRNPA